MATTCAKWASVRGPLLSAVIAAGCLRDVPTEPRGTLDQLSAALTPAAYAALGADGRFDFPTPVAAGEPMIGESRAKELALAFFKSRGPWIAQSSRILDDRAGGIDSDLAPCGRAYLMESAYEQPLAPEFPENVRWERGAKWIVRLCKGDEQQLAVAIPVRAIALQVAADGGFAPGTDIPFLCYRGVEEGVLVPPSPEVGAVAVSRALRTRISAPPVLRRIRGRGCQADFGAVWHFDLEREVEVRGVESRYPRTISVAGYAFPTVLAFYYDIPRWWNYNVVVSPNPWYANQPVEEEAEYYLGPSQWMNGLLRRRPDVAYHNEEITLDRR